MATHPRPPKPDGRPAPERSLLIGLVGGVASGKSAVARFLAECGALWLDCDKLAHRVLDQPEVVGELRALFSDDIVQPNGQVDRQRLAGLVFGENPAATARRRSLEAIIHPRVRALVEQQIAQAGNRYPAIIVDAPLLIEAGWEKLCDRVVMVDTPDPLRGQLAAARGWSPEELARREASQMPLEEKRRHATDTILNDGSLAELSQRVELLWQRISHPAD
jgi:dephospho-CoA kinase